MNRCVLPVVMSALIGLGNLPMAVAATASDPQLNFKIYTPESAKDGSSPSATENTTPAVTDAPVPMPSADNATPAESTSPTSAPAADSAPTPGAVAPAEMKPADSADKYTPASAPEAPETKPNSLQAETPTAAPATSDMPAASSAPAPADSAASTTAASDSTNTDTAAGNTTSSDAQTTAADTTPAEGSDKTAEGSDKEKKTLSGYIRVVPKDTRIPIIMDTAVDSDTSQEGDEFTARTAEDLNIDGAVAVPAGSIIKGRIAQMNAPKHMDRSGSVALKFDTVTTPDNRQIPLVANLVARAGVVHARRGLKDIAIDSSTVLLPTLVGLGIGAVAGKSSSSTSSSTSSSSSSITKPEAAMIGVAVGLAVGVAILLPRKAKKLTCAPATS